MSTFAAEPGAKPQSGLSVMRALSMRVSARSTRSTIVGAVCGAPGVSRRSPGRSRSPRAAGRGHVAGAGGGELHRQVMHLQPVELRQDRIVAAGMVLSPRTRAPARRQRCTASFTPAKPVDHLVDHVDGEVGRAVGVVVLRAHVGIDEQAQMRIVDLHDRHAHVLQQLELARAGSARSRARSRRASG